jgi:hypothetical protein
VQSASEPRFSLRLNPCSSFTWQGSMAIARGVPTVAVLPWHRVRCLGGRGR